MTTEVEVARRLWTISEYQRMGETGILTREDHVELMHGEIVQLTPIGRRHRAAVTALTALVNRRLGERAVVVPQGSLLLPPRSMPEPDVLVLRPRSDFYREVDIRVEDLLLLVEVAETSLRYDRAVKLPLYAVAGIPEAWIVSVEDGSVEIFSDPAPEGYRRALRIERGTPFAPGAFPDLVLSVADILG